MYVLVLLPENGDIKKEKLRRPNERMNVDPEKQAQGITKTRGWF